jgi:glycosyltransferase involved in cell wall biosynthesis
MNKATRISGQNLTTRDDIAMPTLLNKHLRILHVVPSYIPAYRYGGPIYSVHGLCKALSARGHDVHVFTTNVDGPNDSDVPLQTPVDIDGVSVWYFPSRYLRRLYYSPPMERAMNRELKNYDLLHLHSIFLWPTWAAARAARKAGIPYIISPRGMLVRDLIRRKNNLIKSAWITLIERSNLANASAIHVTSNLEEKEAKAFGMKFPPLFVVPNGLDGDDKIEEDKMPSSDIEALLTKRPFLLFVGRINWKKGLDRLINALPLIPHIQLIVAGNDEDKYTAVLESLAQKRGVTDRITFIRQVYGVDKRALFKNALLFVLPSYSENFGIAVIEAMAAGCPVVVTPEVGLSDTVRETGSGIAVQGDPQILAGSINNLLSSPDLMRKMGENGRRTVKERFTWEAIAQSMESVYRNVLE